ncbi:MAG TPA: hypothetical protein VJN19_06505, partial [Propionibacteriaceae bacterium]|nr:hypothetical protein [Propionibacteriaceae bacterium]
MHHPELVEGELADFDWFSPIARSARGVPRYGGARNASSDCSLRSRRSAARETEGPQLRELRLGFFEVWRPDFKIRES